MRAILAMAAALLLAGCASSVMDEARQQAPDARLQSQKPAREVAQCIQYSWQEEAVFGVDASGYLQAQQGGKFTVYTRDAEAFVDVHPVAGGSRVDFFARHDDAAALRRRAAAATCL